MKPKFIIITILCLGFFLRAFNIINNPPALYGDELTIVYDAYSILKTGHDQTGAFLPLTFSMGAGRPAGYVYASIPFVAIFGPSALGVRALSILSGLGIILLLYLIGKKLFNGKVGLAAAAIAAVSPWEISLSRGGFEAHFALLLALLGIYFFLRAKEKSLLYILSALSFGLVLHTYPTYKVSFIFFLPLLLIFKRENLLGAARKNFYLGLIIFLILGIVSLSQTFLGGSETRFSSINIFSQESLKTAMTQKINFERQISELSVFSQYFHNKPVEYGKVFIENYLQNFSADFLFIHGDRNPRHNMATMGEFYLIDAILILIGLLTFWNKDKRVILFLLSWIIIAPIPTAIVDLPHGLRSAFMLPPLLLLSALGLTVLLGNRNKILIVAVSIIFIIQFLFFTQKLYFLAPNEYSNFWSYPAKLGSQIAIENKNNYNYIILSDQIDNLEFGFPVYAKVDPNLVISQNKNRTNLGKYQFKKFDNIYQGYIPDGDIEAFMTSLNGSVLFIGSFNQKKYLSNFESIEGKDKTVALILSRKK